MKFRDRQTHALFIVLVGLFLVSLACSVGGSTPEVTITPSVLVPSTIPPIAQVTASVAITPTVATTPTATPLGPMPS